MTACHSLTSVLFDNSEAVRVFSCQKRSLAKIGSGSKLRKIKSDHRV